MSEAAQPVLFCQSRRAPLLLAAFAFSLGILLGAYVWRPAAWWALAAALPAAAGLALAARRAPAAYALGGTALVALGALAFQLQPDSAITADLSAYTGGGESFVTGYVARDGMLRERGAEQRQIVDIETEQLETEGKAVPLRARIRLSIYARGEYDEETALLTPADQRQLLYGERIRFPAKLRAPHNYQNPGAFDYRGYLARQGVAALAATRHDRVEALAGAGGSVLLRWRSRVRRVVLGRIAELWPPEHAALLSAMLIGERALLDRDAKLEFQRTGVFHILVVSGMNVALVAVCVFWLLRRLRAGELAATLGTMLACGAYAFLAEGDAPVVRAAIMVVLYLAARLLYRERAPLNALGAAALGILVFDPRSLFDASFQLSFLAVLAIAGLALPLLERSSGPRRAALAWLDSQAYDVALPPRLAQFRLDLRMVSARLAPFFGERAAKRLVVTVVQVGLIAWEVMLVSAVMQVALALPMAWHFHRAMLLGLPANILVTPIVAVLVPLSSLAVLVALVSPAAAALFAFPAELLLAGMLRLLGFLGGLRAAELRVAAPGVAVAAACVAAFAFALFAVRRGRWVALAGIAALTACAAWIAFVPPRPQLRPGVLEVTALDVGQGDALLIVAPRGRTLLVDAGGSLRSGEFDVGEEVVSSYLWTRGLTRLDAIALSHGHADHIGGLHAVIANFRPRELWVGAVPDVPAYRLLLRQAERYGVRVRRLAAGDAFDFGGAQVRVLAPPLDWVTKARPRNDDSLAFELAHGETVALLPGDVERKVERQVAASASRAVLLKVAHHGSHTSTTPELLAAARPQVAVISVGYRSPFGHPRAEVLERLEQAGVATYRTDVHGAVTFVLDGKGVSVTPPSRR